MLQTLGRLLWIAVGAIAIKALETSREGKGALARVSRATTSRRVHPKRVHRPTTR